MTIDVHFIRHHAEDNVWVRQIVEEAGLDPFNLDTVDDETIAKAVDAAATARVVRGRQRRAQR